MYDTLTIPEPVRGAYDDKVPPFESDEGKFHEMVVWLGIAPVNSGEKKVALSVFELNIVICAGF